MTTGVHIMRQEMFKFKFGDMPVSFPRSAAVGSAILMICLCIAGIMLTNLAPLDILLLGIFGTLLHWFSELVHQYGHFFAAKRTGHPATGVVLWWLLGTTKYPRNESTLPAKVHIQRALGGPIASAIFAVIVTIISFVWLRSFSEAADFLAVWMMLENWLIFTLGALFPPITIGFFSNDGGTIWKYIRQK
jgi:hypothetical protein